jgi:SagB-type dehydrogenase family enzyme
MLLMKRHSIVLFLFAAAGFATAADIQLPPPQTTGGKPLMTVLKERKSSRQFSSRPLPPQVLSNLLWAAFGINRPDGRRTAPSAVNWQETSVYVVLPEGAYVYDAQKNLLREVASGDLRKYTGSQDFVATAPVNLVYVADLSKTGRDPNSESTQLFTNADTGFIAQNVYLFCASEGLATVVRGLVNREELAKVLKLRPNQRITLSQTVGYPPQ